MYIPEIWFYNYFYLFNTPLQANNMAIQSVLSKKRRFNLIAVQHCARQGDQQS